MPAYFDGTAGVRKPGGRAPIAAGEPAPDETGGEGVAGADRVHDL